MAALELYMHKDGTTNSGYKHASAFSPSFVVRRNAQRYISHYDEYVAEFDVIVPFGRLSNGYCLQIFALTNVNYRILARLSCPCAAGHDSVSPCECKCNCVNLNQNIAEAHDICDGLRVAGVAF